jgi:putative transposase
MSAKKTSSGKRGKERSRGRGRRQSRRGKRYTPEQREHVLTLVAAGMSQGGAGKTIGATGESVRRWVGRAKATGTMPTVPAVEPKQPDKTPATVAAAVVRSVYAPADPGQGLSGPEEAAIVEYKRRHPSYGPAQIRAQLKRFKGWRISNKAIARVLRSHGYELVHVGSRPKGDEEPTRFEAPRRNALWQMDFTELRVGDDKLHLLVALDDFSRFIVGHALCDSPSSTAATALLRSAMARHGKPEAVRTDRGGAFVAKDSDEDFARVLELELIDHIVGRSYHPQGGGKVEAVIGTVRRELWDVEHFSSRSEAERRLSEFIADYNERRAHMALDGLTPADRFFGRADQVLDVINALSRKRQGMLARYAPDGTAVEELGGNDRAAPMEVLRLVIVAGHMELRLCGARVRLGPVEI